MALRAFTGGRILTMDPALGEPEAVVVAHGRIAAVGEGGVVDVHGDSEAPATSKQSPRRCARRLLESTRSSPTASEEVAADDR